MIDGQSNACGGLQTKSCNCCAFSSNSTTIQDHSKERGDNTKVSGAGPR